MARSIRTGIIGSGFAARFHYSAVKRVTAAEPVFAGVYSTTKANADIFAAERGIDAVENEEALIKKSDIIHICTPPASHEELIIKVLKADKHVIVEKPLTGFFGNGIKDFNGDTFSRAVGLEKTLDSLKRIAEAEAASNGIIMYAENWVYAPAVIKEKEIIEKSGAKVLRMSAEQSHSGSHSRSYGIWSLSGGGSLIGKGCHPLSAAVYFKHAEGISATGKAIRPVAVSARTHAVTRSKNFTDRGHLRASYTDIEDYGIMHVIFSDGTFADITASELALGGVFNRIEVFADNHRTVCNLSPTNAMQCYTPDSKYLESVYTVEKIETKEGWSPVSPDESWFSGYQHEMEDFYRCATENRSPECGSALAFDVISTIYSAYLSAERKGAETGVTLV